MAEHYREL